MTPRIRNSLLGAAAYIASTFPITYAWHLIWFGSYYDRLEVYLDDIIVPFGMLSVLVEGVEGPVELDSWEAEDGVDAFSDEGANEGLAAGHGWHS